MDPGLHVKQAVNHLERVLGYAPFAAEGSEATVHLTWEDWNVVADMLFHMDTPREFIPEAIRAFRMDPESQTIHLSTDAYEIRLEIV
jgi:hypothetical protein